MKGSIWREIIFPNGKMIKWHHDLVELLPTMVKYQVERHVVLCFPETIGIPNVSGIAFWATDSDDRIIASLNVELESQTPTGRMTIYNVCVDPEHRSRGYGKQLLNYTISTLQDLIPKAKPVYLDVYQDNLPAYKVYTSVGFKPFSTYSYQNKLIDSMVLQLQPKS